MYLGTNHLDFPEERIQSLKTGNDRDYSSNLLSMLGRIEQDWIILWLEDRFLSGPVDTGRMCKLVQHAQDKNAGYLKLIANYPLAQVADSSLQIGEIPKGVRYRVSMTVALWQKKVLSRILRSGETAWDIERNGSIRADDFDEKFYCIPSGMKDNPPIENIHGIVKGKWVRGAYHFLCREGLQDCMEKRPVESIWSLIYNKAYIFRLSVYDKLGLYWRQQTRIHDH